MKGRERAGAMYACLIFAVAALAHGPAASEWLDAEGLAERLGAVKEPAQRVALIRQLQGTEDRALIPVLREQAKAGSPPVAWACLDVLAGLGVPPHEVFAADAGFTRDEHVRYGAAYLKAAGVLLERGDTAYAERIYLKVLEVGPDRRQIVTAIKGLGAIGSRAFVRHALGSIDNPALHEDLVGILAEADVPRLDAMLAYSFRVPGMTPAQRTSILRVLEAREWDRLDELLELAQDDESADVRVVASELLGKPPSETDLLAVATGGIVWNRADAAADYLNRAEQLMARGETDAARTMYENIAAETGAEIKARVAAITGVETIGDAKSLGLLKRLTRQPQLSDAAARAVRTIESGSGAAGKGAEK